MAFPRSDVRPGASPGSTPGSPPGSEAGPGTADAGPRSGPETSRDEDGDGPGDDTAAQVAPTTVKIVVAGGFAVGKTTFIGSISDIEPLSTEAAMTEHGLGVDDAGGVSDRKTTTTVAMDFGRISLPGNLWLYLFGTPGQDRFSFMWDDLIRGAIGAVVLVDTTRLEQCFDAVEYFEARRIPFVVAVNCFDGVARHGLEDVRDALAVRPDTPLFYIDARSRAAAKQALVALVTLAMTRV